MSISIEIAMTALEQYPIRIKSVDLIGQSANVIYKVVDDGENSYSLRLHASKSETLEAVWTDCQVIQSEMVWLQALSQETDLVVPKPCYNNQGEFVTKVQDINCTLVGWVEGEQKPFIPTAEDAGAIGKLIGKLHKQAASWNTPELFSRPHFDEVRILNSLDKLREQSELGHIAAENTKILMEAGYRAISTMNAIEKTQDNWGMIHGDLITTNILFHSNEARAIDFGACGFGLYLFDLGWSFSYIHPSFRRTLLDAYSEYVALPSNHVELLESFFVATQLETMNFWLGLPDVMEWLPNHIDNLTSREFKCYVNNETFLFNGTPYWE